MLLHNELEIWGRAQHEAARRPRYDLKCILGSCKMCKNLRSQHPVRAELLSPEKSPVGWFNMSVYNFLVSGQKFTQFLCPIGDEM